MSSTVHEGWRTMTRVGFASLLVACAACSDATKSAPPRGSAKPDSETVACDASAAVRDTGTRYEDARQLLPIWLSRVKGEARPRPCVLVRTHGEVAHVEISYRKGVQPDLLRRGADAAIVRDALATVPGVDRVLTYGAEQPVLLVEVDERRPGPGASDEDILAALQRAPQQLAAGSTDSGDRWKRELGALRVGAAGSLLGDIADIRVESLEVVARGWPGRPLVTVLAIFATPGAPRAWVYDRLNDRSDALSEFAGDPEHGGGPPGIIVEVLP